ncbi:MAG: PASTA domain-containing protein [Clostridia bacterium]|nr:PASTA domain-containing protein [Clostridia bacterium]
MPEQLKYCMGCMESIPFDTVICPKCGYNEQAAQPAPYLKAGSLIMRKYLVGKVLGTTTDTVTYIGANIETGETVTVNEFFPEKIVTRTDGRSEVNVKLGYDSMYSNCLQSFLKLWRGLDVFKDARCLPNVLDIVDFNGTVYSVCAYKDCIPLNQYFKNTGTPLTWSRAFSAFKPVMYALKKLNYSGIIHGNLNPETILVGADGKLHISGFSIPQCHSGVVEFASEPMAGFAPVELYEPTGATASTDIYSVTALLYYCITMLTPPDALSRVINDTASLPASVATTLSRSVINGLIHGLSVHPENRYSNFDELITALTPPAPSKSSGTVTNAAAGEKQSDEKAQQSNASKDADFEKVKSEKKETEKGSEISAFSLAIKAFIAGILMCVIIFCSLYATVLYKNYPIDFLDNLFAPFSFLPMNQEPETTLPTTTLPVPTEPNYITVADFVNNHTYDSIRSNPYFNENYKFNFKFEESISVPKNGIISQSVQAGESVIAGVEITLVVSSGTNKIKLPDVIDMNYRDAVRILEDAGFKVKLDVLQNNGKHTVGEVYGMNKIADGLYEKDTEITIQVWGKAPETTTVSPEDDPALDVTSDDNENPATDSTSAQ